MGKFENLLKKELSSHIDLKNPEFDNAGKVHDWRNYVDDLYIENWDKLTEREKIIIATMADKQASAEEWD